MQLSRFLLPLLCCASLRAADSQPFLWQQAQAKSLPQGDLEWTPQPFQFTAGKTLRYIDYESGDDAGPGSKAKPWKHHPWDLAAQGQAKAFTAPATFVFKGGVVYRGKLRATSGGSSEETYRLTCDPSWGNGPATLVGSRTITGNWQRASAETAPDIPEPEKVWYLDLPKNFDPIDHMPDRYETDEAISQLWMLNGDRIQRMDLARDPNYQAEPAFDPFSTWHHWQVFEGKTSSGWLTDNHWQGKPASLFDGAVMWTQHNHLMGTPFRQKLSGAAFDSAKGAFNINGGGGVQFRPFWDRNFQKPVQYKPNLVAYFLERVPQFLDAPYEYYYRWQGPLAGRLYVRLADGEKPADMQFEAGIWRSIVEIHDQSRIEISGLQFAFNDGEDGTYNWPPQIGASPAIRLVGSCQDITVRNCRFHNVMQGVVGFPRPEPGDSGPPSVWSKEIGPYDNDVMDDILLCDNDLQDIEHEGALWLEGNSENPRGQPFGRLLDVQILRNRIRNASFRSGARGTSNLAAIRFGRTQTATVAGNQVYHCWGAGIWGEMGKNGNGGAFNELPLLRTLVFDNKIVDTMIGCCDYGGINIYQGGPVYIFNNLIHNTIGSKPFNGEEMGYSLYLDGCFKAYSFNNILTGRADDPNYYNHVGYFMVFGFLDHFWNNTVYRFQRGVDGSSGNRSAMLGNIFVDMEKTFLGQNRPGDVSMLYGGDTGEQGAKGIATMAYANNVFEGSPTGGLKKGEGSFGYVGGTKRAGEKKAEVIAGNTLEELSQALARMQAQDATIGVQVAQSPLVNPAQGDLRPKPGSAAAGRGAKMFVPWALSRVVAEWHFTRNQAAPQVVLGEHFYMQEEYFKRDMYYNVPRNDLLIEGDVSADDYQMGTLEDWIPGALPFDGKRQGRLSHVAMTRDHIYPIGPDANGKIQNQEYTWSGSERRTLDMDTNNFLLEVVLQRQGSGVIIQKHDGTNGYSLSLNQQGACLLTLGGQQLAFTASIPTGSWHHLLVEVDRAAGEARCYLDGKAAGSAKLALAATASLANPADVLVGAGGFTGSLDFLRVSRGTLADAQTNIAELYAWEFDNPSQRDFAGRAPAAGQSRYAGALEP